MRIKISIEMTGPDQWSDGQLNGQTMARAHSFDVEFDDDKCQMQMISLAIERLIRAVDPPRKAMLLADLADSFGEDANEDVEKAFFEAADAVLSFWKESDRKIDALMEQRKDPQA